MYLYVHRYLQGKHTNDQAGHSKQLLHVGATEAKLDNVVKLQFIQNIYIYVHI